MDLQGKVVIISGGGTGLGRDTAIGLARAGADISLCGRRRQPLEEVAAEIRALGRRALPIPCDISDPAAVQAMVERTVQELGRIDVLVNNAAIYPRRPWTEVTVEEWDRVFEVNMRGFFVCARAVYPYFKAQGKGKIVNISSITFFIGFANLLAYASTKGAIVGFTRTLAREVGPDGITVNCVAPGAFPTDAEKIHPNLEQYNQYILDQQAIKRRGRPEDIANAVLFFASDASDFITGQTLLVDGGWYMH